MAILEPKELPVKGTIRIPQTLWDRLKEIAEENPGYSMNDVAWEFLKQKVMEYDAVRGSDGGEKVDRIKRR